MKKTFCIVLSVIMLAGCCYRPFTKEQYISCFKEFVFGLENEYEFFTEEEWEEIEDEYLKYSEVYYKRFKDDLTTKDIIKINYIRSVYYGYKVKNELQDFMGSLSSGISGFSTHYENFPEVLKNKVSSLFIGESTEDDITPILTLSKGQFIDYYSVFIDQVSVGYLTYTWDEWKITNRVFAQFYGVYYEAVKDDLTQSEKEQINALHGKYFGYITKWGFKEGIIAAAKIAREAKQYISRMASFWSGFYEAFNE